MRRTLLVTTTAVSLGVTGYAIAQPEPPHLDPAPLPPEKSTIVHQDLRCKATVVATDDTFRVRKLSCRRR